MLFYTGELQEQQKIIILSDIIYCVDRYSQHITDFADRHEALTILLISESPGNSEVHGFVCRVLIHRAVSTLLFMSCSWLISFTH